MRAATFNQEDKKWPQFEIFNLQSMNFQKFKNKLA